MNDGLIKALRRTEGQLDMAGWDAPPGVYLIYQDDPDVDKFRLKQIEVPPEQWAAWEKNNEPYGPAQMLYAFADTSRNLEIHRVAPENWRGWAFACEVWLTEPRTAAESRRHAAAQLERALDLIPGRVEMRALAAQLTSGRSAYVQRRRGAPGVEIYDSATDDGPPHTGAIFRALRMLCGLSEDEAKPPPVAERLFRGGAT